MSEATLVSSALLPASQRPVPFVRRRDLETREIRFEGVPSHVLKDPVALRYHRLTEPQYFVLQSLDGRASLTDLRDALQQRFPQTFWNFQALQQLIADFHTKRLTVSQRAGQGRVLIGEIRKERWNTLRQTLANILYLKLPGVDPTPLLRVLAPLISWMYSRWFVTAALLAGAGSLLWITVYFDEFRRALPEFSQFFTGPNLVAMWFILAVIKVLHELGHALTCRRFGGECHQIGVMVLVFSPTLYCDVSDAWMMPNKWHRIAIGGAGMFVEMLLSILALVVWWNTQPGLVHQLALNVFFVTTVTTALFNANPLIRLDGYYMLSDFLEVPNLSQKAQESLWNRFGETCLGIEPRQDPFDPRQNHGWFTLYAVASVIYRLFLTVTIGTFLYQVLKPWRLESLGGTLAVFSMGGMAVGAGWKFTQMVRTPRDRPLSRGRIIVTTLLLVAALGGILLIPVPIYVEAPFTVQPRDVRHVSAMQPGVLREVLVQPGDRVQAGQVLARLTNEELEDRRRELDLELQLQRTKVESFDAIGSPAEKALAQQHVESLDQQIAELDAQLAQLTLRAPAAGRVIAPPAQPEAPRGVDAGELPKWHGTPLLPENRGMSIPPRTHFCSLAPGGEFEAVLLVDQLDRNDLRPGDGIRLKFDHLPQRVFDGVIRHLSPRQQDFAPPQLSSQSGGTLSTTPDDEGRQRLSSLAYEATVDFPQSGELLQTGYRGRARKVLTHRPLGAWAYRWVRRTLYFRL